MPVKKEREYRTLVAPLAAQSSGEKRLQSECYVEGYATTFNAPYLLYEFEDGTKIYERIDAHALDSADMSDVIMQYAKTGETTGKGVFTIVEVKAGQGASAGWGRLKSGAGWISLDYATRLA